MQRQMGIRRERTFLPESSLFTRTFQIVSGYLATSGCFLTGVTQALESTYRSKLFGIGIVQ